MRRGPHLEEGLSVVREQAVGLRLVLAVKGVQSEALPLENKRDKQRKGFLHIFMDGFP